MPSQRRIDRELVGGAALFGIGWGIAGFCPGGAIPALGLGHPQTPIFLAAMIAGIVIARAIRISAAGSRQSPEPMQQLPQWPASGMTRNAFGRRKHREDHMEYRQITDDYAVSGQITADDIAAIKEAGFRSIICNRPDDEQPGQPSAAGNRRGGGRGGADLPAHPIHQRPDDREDVQKMAEALDEIPGPVFAFCRSGARSTNIFMAAEQEKR